MNIKNVGKYILNLLESNADKLVGGVAMIGLGLLCKKLGVSSDVLTRSGYASYSDNITQFPTYSLMMANNPFEASLNAIATTGLKQTDEWYKLQNAKKIYNLLKDSSLSQEDKTYGINMLSALANSCRDNWYSNEILKLICTIK